MKKLVLLSWVIVLSSFLVSCVSYEKEVTKKLKIEHIFAQPSKAYGPGTLVMYEKRSGYTKTCFAWDVLNISEIEYYDKAVKYNSIADITITKSTNIEFDIRISESDLLPVDAKYANITSLKLDLKNGFQGDIDAHISTLFSNIFDEESINYKDLVQKAKSHPKAKFYLILVSYGYDFSYSYKRDNQWNASMDLPESVLKVLGAKVGISFSSDSTVAMNGERMFIGFNGDPVVLKTDKTNKRLLVPTAMRGPVVFDITEAIKLNTKK